MRELRSGAALLAHLLLALNFLSLHFRGTCGIICESWTLNAEIHTRRTVFEELLAQKRLTQMWILNRM